VALLFEIWFCFVLNLWSSCLDLPNAGITGMCLILFFLSFQLYVGTFHHLIYFDYPFLYLKSLLVIILLKISPWFLNHLWVCFYCLFFKLGFQLLHTVLKPTSWFFKLKTRHCEWTLVGAPSAIIFLQRGLGFLLSGEEYAFRFCYDVLQFCTFYWVEHRSVTLWTWDIYQDFRVWLKLK
jgi:hypothetical protein